MNYQQEIKKLESFFNSGYYRESVQNAGYVLEHALREVLTRLKLSLNAKELRSYLEWEEQICGNAPLSDCGLGKLVGLHEKAKDNKFYAGVDGLHMSYSHSLPLSKFARLRNDCTHRESAPDLKDVEYMISGVRLFLREFNLLEGGDKDPLIEQNATSYSRPHFGGAGIKAFNNEEYTRRLLDSWIPQDWVFKQFEEFRNSKTRTMYVSGTPGSGKSSVMAYLGAKSDCLSAIHYCKYEDKETHVLSSIIKHFACKISGSYTTYMSYLGEQANSSRSLESLSNDELLNTLIIEPLLRFDIQESILLLIDALDEIPVNKRSELLSFLVRNIPRLPPNISLVLSSRNDAAVGTSLSPLRPFRLENIETMNREGILAYIGSFLSDCGIATDREVIKKIYLQSGGDFIYVSFILDEIRIRKPKTISELHFPIGMKAVCEQYFDRHFTGRQEEFVTTVRPFLEIISAAREPISLETILKIHSFDENQLIALLKTLENFLSYESGKVSIYHKSLFDWITNMSLTDRYYVSIDHGSKLIANWAASNCQQYIVDGYVLRYGFEHMFEHELYQEIVEGVSSENEQLLDSFSDFMSELLVDGRMKEANMLARILISQPKVSVRAVLNLIKALQFHDQGTFCRNILTVFSGRPEEGLITAYSEFSRASNSNADMEEIIELGRALLSMEGLDRQTTADVSCLLGDGLRKTGSHHASKEYYEKARSLCAFDTENQVYYDSELALIDIAYVCGDIGVAIDRCKSVLDSIDTQTPSLVLYKTYRTFGNIYHSTSENSSARDYFSRALEVVYQLNIPSKLVGALNSLASVLEDDVAAFNNLFECRRICELHSVNRLEYGKSFYIAAEIDLRNNRFESALKNCSESIGILTAVGYQSGLAEAFLLKGMAELAVGNSEQAIEDIERSYQYYKGEEIYVHLRVRAMHRLSLLYRERQDRDALSSLQSETDIPFLKYFPKACLQVEEINSL